MTPEEERLSDLLKRAVAEPPLTLTADQVTARRRPAWGSRRSWIFPAVVASGTAAVVAAAVTMTVLTVASPDAKAKGPRPLHAVAAPLMQASVKPSLGQSGWRSKGVTYAITPGSAGASAATVLRRAADAAPAGPPAGVNLTGGWPADATYWHVTAATTQSICPGESVIGDTWLNPDGDLVVEHGPALGPKLSTPGCGGSLLRQDLLVVPGHSNAESVSGGPAGVLLGGRLYSWAQFARLPTDPAKLWPVLKADSTAGAAPYEGTPEMVSLWQTMVTALASDPVSPAMRKALYEAAENIPGITVRGTYTDSLGRTGTALRLDGYTAVLDTGDGQVLATVAAAPPGSAGCFANPRPVMSAPCQASGTETQVYLRAGPARTEPAARPASNGLLVTPSPASPAGKKP